MTELKTQLDVLRNIDFTALDYESIQRELIDYVNNAASAQGIVDDFMSGDAAKVFIDLFSYIGDILAFRIDTLANENYVSTAQRRQSLINILEPLGQAPLNPTTALLTLSAVPVTVTQSQINLGQRYQLETTGLDGNTVYFELMNGPTEYFSEVIIPAGVTNHTVQSYSGRYASFDIISPGTSTFEFSLPQFPVIQDSVLVSVTPTSPALLTSEIIQSTRATPVDSLVNSSTDIIYKIRYDEDGKAICTFATADFGKIPPKGHTIHVDYRIDGGKNTNIGIGAIEATATFVDGGGNLVDVIFSNPDTFAQGGQDLEDLENVRIRAPAEVRANENLVSLTDYVAVINGIPGVQDVFAANTYTDSTIPDNTAFIWVLPSSGGEVSPDLRALIAYRLELNRLTAIENIIFNPVYEDWDLTVSVKLLSTGTASEVRPLVMTALLNTFGRDTATFENQVRTSQIISTIQAISGVDYVTLTTPTADLVASNNTVLRLIENNISLTII